MIQIRTAELGDARSISDLMVPVADEFVARDYSAQGRKSLLDGMTPEAVRGFIENGHRFHMAIRGGIVLGMVSTRNDSHLFHLFIKPAAQGRGIGRRLWEVACDACLEAGNQGEFTVNSAPGAVGFYEKLGFVARANECKDGVSYVAMAKQLKDSPSSRA